MELGSRLCIVLPQLPPLQARHQQVKFLEDVRTYKEDCSTLTPEVIDRLLQEGATVVPHHKIELERSMLFKLKGNTTRK